MIISRLQGGLGNQMFQYAAGLALAEQRRTLLKLDASWFKEYAQYESHNRYALSCFNITEQFATEEEVDRLHGLQLTRTERWSVAIGRALRLRQYVRRLSPAGPPHRPPSVRFYPEFFDLRDNTYLGGMFQSPQFFAPVENLLRMHFSLRYPAPPHVARMADRIRSGPSAAIHFRRGDYARNPTFAAEMGVIGTDYYQRAVTLLRERSPDATLYIFSDDIDAVAREFHPPGPHEFVRCVAHWHPWDKIRLMSQCDHIAIANSTFSWWAAWLNPSPDKLVVAPDPWFAGKPGESPDIVPRDWVQLPWHV